jgi:hypothetical protein
MVWQKTKKQFLLRDKLSGRYYCRLLADGKQHWFSLKTNVFAVAGPCPSGPSLLAVEDAIKPVQVDISQQR